MEFNIQQDNSSVFRVGTPGELYYAEQMDERGVTEATDFTKVKPNFRVFMVLLRWDQRNV
jgi:hypothetical protein